MSTTMKLGQNEQTFKTVAPGVELCVLRKHADSAGMTVMFRMAKGALARMHDHPGGEETYLVYGKLRVGERVLGPGDYLWTAAGETHDGVAEEACAFFVVLPGGFEIVA